MMKKAINLALILVAFGLHAQTPTVMPSGLYKYTHANYQNSDTAKVLTIVNDTLKLVQVATGTINEAGGTYAEMYNTQTDYPLSHVGFTRGFGVFKQAANGVMAIQLKDASSVTGIPADSVYMKIGFFDTTNFHFSGLKLSHDSNGNVYATVEGEYIDLFSRSNILLSADDTLILDVPTIYIKNDLYSGSESDSIVTISSSNILRKRSLSSVLSSLSLDEAYNNGRTITADAGAMKIDGTDGLLVAGTFGAGADIELSASNSVMTFNPQKAAFRAGFITTSNWNKDSIGSYSFAVGNNTKALGQSSAAIGASAFAVGNSSFSLGSSSISWGPASVTMGFNTQAFSFNEVVLGRHNTHYSPLSPSGTNGSDRLFVVGNGVDTFTRSNAITVLKNGRMALGNITPTQRLHVGGQVRIDTLASGSASDSIVTVGATGILNKRSVSDVFNYTQPVLTFATLPVSPTVGTIRFINDADTPAWHTPAVGGGGDFTGVYWNGTNWICF